MATSFVPGMEALGVSVAQGSHRVVPADAVAAKIAPGGWPERYNAWVTKATKGQLTPQLVQEGMPLSTISVKQPILKAISQSQMAAAGGENTPFASNARDDA